MAESRAAWLKFAKSTKLVGTHAGKVEGSIGQRLSLLKNVVFELGECLYSKFYTVWEEPRGSWILPTQQSCALEACREVQNSINFLIEIYKIKLAEQQDIAQKRQKIKEKATVPKNVDEEPTFPEKDLKDFGEDSSIADQLNDYVPSNDEGPLFEVKEEPVEIKEEPVDDVVQVKEEPIEDIFCPATGSSRPINLTANDLQQRQMQQQKSVRGAQTGMAIFVRRPAAAEIDRNQSRGIPSTMNDVPMLAGPLPRCALRCKQTRTLIATPFDRPKRIAFLDRILKPTAFAVSAVKYLKNNQIPAYFCITHLAKKKGPNLPREPVGMSILKRAVSSRSLGIPAMPRLSAQAWVAMQEERASATVKAYTCFLCGQKAFPHLLTPRDPASSPYFFENLVELDEEQNEKVNHIIQSARSVPICRSHYREQTRRITAQQNDRLRVAAILEIARSKDTQGLSGGPGTKRSRTDPPPVYFSDDFKEEPCDDEPGPSEYDSHR